MNSGAESLLVIKAKGLRHLFATVPAMLTDTRMAQFQKGEQLEPQVPTNASLAEGGANLITSAHVHFEVTSGSEDYIYFHNTVHSR